MKTTYTIDGAHFTNLQEFYNEFSLVVLSGKQWGKNLDAFDDVLSGGFGTPDDGFIFVWKNSVLSRERLGFAETLKYLEHQLSVCDSSQRNSVFAEIENLKKKEGQMLFDMLIEIINEHADIELRLA